MMCQILKSKYDSFFHIMLLFYIYSCITFFYTIQTEISENVIHKKQFNEIHKIGVHSLSQLTLFQDIKFHATIDNTKFFPLL
jgi:hypothetical protein